MSDEFPLKWTQAPAHGFGPPPQRESYKLEYRHDPLTKELQYRYRPDGPYHSGSGKIIAEAPLSASTVVNTMIMADWRVEDE
jgi:hypothetical protein